MNQDNVSIVSDNSWKTYVVSYAYPTFYLALLLGLIIFKGEATMFSSAGASTVKTSDLPLFSIIAFAIMAIAGWIAMHRHVDLDDSKIVISSPKIYLSMIRVPLWELSSLKIGANWLERLLGIVHIEFFGSTGAKTLNDLRGFQLDKASEFVRSANDLIVLAKAKPHDPILMDASFKKQSHRLQIVGYTILSILILLFVVAGYVITHI